MPCGSEAGDSQPDVPSFMKGMGRIPSTYTGKGELSSIGPIPTFTSPDVTSMTISHSPFGVPGEPGSPWLYYGMPNQQ